MLGFFDVHFARYICVTETADAVPLDIVGGYAHNIIFSSHHSLLM